MSNATLPSNISFTEEDIQAASVRPELKEGWYQFLIKSPENDVADSGHLQTKMQLKPLKVEGDPDSTMGISVRNNLFHPFRNPDREDHKPPNTAGLCHSFYRACFGNEIPDYPRMINKKWYLDGELLSTEEEVQGARVEANRATFEKSQEIWVDPTLLENHAIYGYAYKNGEYLNAKNFCAELPEGETLVDPEEAIVRNVKEKPAAAPANGKARAGKPGKKK